MDFGMQLLRMLGALALVLGLLVMGLYAVKRFGLWIKKPDENQWIQVLGRHYLDPKHCLLVVQAKGQIFLLGISPQGLQLLSPLESPGDVPEQQP